MRMFILYLLLLQSLSACNPKANEDRLELISVGSGLLGTSYSTGYKRGFDCSGFVQYCYRSIDQKIPRSSRNEYESGIKINRKKARLGDIIVITGSNARKRIPGHVALIHHLAGDTLYFIHSSSSSGVIISNDKEPYYRDRYLGIVSYISD